jgi:hypothetical protein
MNIIPYVEIDGSWTLKNSQVHEVFARMDPAVQFPQGTVRNGADLIRLWREVAVAHVIEHGGKFVWAAWLTDVQSTHAFGHFCRLGGDVPGRLLGKKSLEYWWKNTPLDVVLGLTPEDNAPALNMVRKMGFTLHPPIKNMLLNAHTGQKVGAVLSEVHRNGD